MVSRDQLLDAGLTRREIGRRLQSGRLHSVHRGVYVVGHTVLPPLAAEQAALLACGPGAALSHRSGAVVLGLLPPKPGPVDVTCPPPHRRSRPGIRVHRRPEPPPTVIRHGLPVTTPARTLLDLKAAVDAEELDQATSEAQLRRLVPRDERPGRGPTRSKAERRLRALLKQARLPLPETNVKLHGHEVDALWRTERLVVEMDSYAFHSSRAAFESDRARDADLALADYTVLRVTWRQMTREPYPLVARLAAAIRRGAT